MEIDIRALTDYPARVGLSRPRSKPATYDDILALPGDVGELHVEPRPAPHHAAASSVLGGELSLRHL